MRKNIKKNIEKILKKHRKNNEKNIEENIEKTLRKKNINKQKAYMLFPDGTLCVERCRAEHSGVIEAKTSL